MNKYKSSGFSLLELLLAVSMITVIAAIAVPTFQNLVRSHAGDELVSELNLARMIAIRNNRPLTVAFNPGTPRCTMTWIDAAGLPQNKFFSFENMGEGFVFDPAPPGGGATPAPDNTLFISEMGFINNVAIPGIGAGNVYLVNRDNSTFFQIQTTLAGGIMLNRWSQPGNNWVSVY